MRFLPAFFSVVMWLFLMTILGPLLVKAGFFLAMVLTN